MTPAITFNLTETLGSGQVFHWESLPDGGFCGLIGEAPVLVRQTTADGAVEIFPPDATGLVREYLGLDHPMERILGSFPQDDLALQTAVNFGRGLRIIRQPKWECLATFITSAMKQVAHIRQISLTLRRQHGRGIEFAGTTLHTYPGPEVIAGLSEASLRAEARLGYRAPHLLGTARMIAGGEVDLEAIATLPHEEARRQLCRLPGVGEKVANCVLLFAYGHLGAFPVDVWIARALRQAYFLGQEDVPLKILQAFATAHFGKFGGYAQQYLFHHARSGGRSPHKGNVSFPLPESLSRPIE